MVQTVVERDQINIDSIRYKLRGPVKITLPDTQGEKIVLGDFTQEALRRRNVIRWSDLRGGIGLELVSPQDANVDLHRCFYTDCYLWDPGHITLSRAFVSVTGDPAGAHDGMEFFNGQLYIAGFSGDVHRTSTSSDTLSDTTHDLTNRNVDSVAGRIGGTDYIIWGQDGSGYEFSTDGASYTTGGREGHFLVIWDDRLWGFDIDDHQLWFTLAPSNTAGDHTDDAILPAEIGTALGMFTGPDANGQDIIYVLARDALWAHDAANGRFVKTMFQIINPIKRDASELVQDYRIRPVAWRGSVYIPVAGNVFQYFPGPGEAFIRSIGPSDEDHTLPGDIVNGPIRALAASDQSLWALNDLSLSQEDSGASVLLEWRGRGWQTSLRLSEGSPSPGNPSFLMKVGVQEKTSTSEYRVWIQSGGVNLFGVELSEDLISPKHSTSWRYGPNTPLGGITRMVVYPWVDVGTDSDSIALRLKVDGLDLTATETLTVKYRTNYSTRTSLAGFTALGSALTSSGLTELTFPDNGVSVEGLAFRHIQFLVELDEDAAGGGLVSPDLVSLEFEWFRKGTTKLAFDFEIDMREEYADRPPMQQFFDFLNSVKNSTVLLEITWKDTSQTQNSITRTYYTTITAFELTEENSGPSYGGIMLVRAEEV